jgi:predicted dithiol-disulfide oxidoreductase (DUF899 family)
MSAKPPVVDEAAWRAALDELRTREKAATRELDAIAAQHTNGRGVEHLTHTFALVDSVPWGRQEEWQDSPDGWPKTPTYSGWLDSPDIARLYGQ